MSSLELSLQQLQEISRLLAERIEQGLRRDGEEIGCLPTYLALPSGKQSGRSLVVDTGGTNTRAALVNLKAHDGKIEAGPNARKVPDGRDGEALQAEFFFGTQAQQADPFPRETPLPLGYCFSYPTQATADGDAILLRWTKGLQVDDTVNQRVGQPLKQQLEQRGHQITSVRVLNDTVASLLGGVHLYAEPRYGQNYIGLILGTGTNMAGVFPLERLEKVGAASGFASKTMVVNLESGNFSPPHLTEYDDQVDRASNNPGFQRFEKAVSGHYLPYVFDAIHPGAINPEDGTQKLVELRDQGQGEHAHTAGLLLTRSARLAAAGLAGLAMLYPPGDTAVLGEGSLFWGDPQFVQTVKATLKELDPERHYEIVKQREGVNLLGAACAALTPSA
jgi:hexokinase